MKLYIFLWIFHWTGSCYPQSVNTLLGARAAGMGYAVSSIADASSLFGNVAAMSWSEKSAFLTAYEVSPALPGSNRAGAGMLVAKKSLASGVGFFRFGDDIYNEQVVGMGLSNKFGATSLGIRLNYVQYQAVGMGTKQALSITFGGLTRISSHVSVGAYAVNLNQPHLSTDERLPTKLVAGIQVNPVPHFRAVAELEKDVIYDPTLKAGAEYVIHKKIAARTGFNVNPNAVFFGIGIHPRNLFFDYAVRLNIQAGPSHQASCVYEFGKTR